jgi:hypothetical protein
VTSAPPTTATSRYLDVVDATEHHSFAEGGIETTAGACLRITEGSRLAEPEGETFLDLAL